MKDLTSEILIYYLKIPLVSYLVLISSLVSFVQSCPALCTCRNNAVDCTGKHLRMLPESLPKQTTKLRLSQNAFTNIPDLSTFPYLEELVISHNAISVISGNRISSLSKLKFLDISHNKIQSLPKNMFPLVNQLEKINANNNNLSDVSALSSPLLMLKELNLQNNHIKSLDVVHGNQMPSLHTLRVGFNELEKLEAPLDKGRSGFPLLRHLELNNNRISSISMFLTRFKSLKKLVLSHNLLRNLDGTSFLRNDDLEELYLDHNQLSVVTYMWFTFKQKLIYLDLKDNYIHTIDEGAFKSAMNVKYIDLSNNNLGSLGTGFLYQLHELSYLNLHGNNIGYVSEHAFFGLGNLLSLNLSHNEISIGDKEFDTAFEPLQKLKILDLSTNNILLIPMFSFSGLSTLETLYLRNNDIKIIEKDAFKHLTSVTALYFESSDLLCDCSIKFLKDWIREKGLISMIKGVCSTPRWIKDKNIMNVLATELVCDFNIGANSKHTNRPKIAIHPRSKYAFLHGNATLQCVVTSSKNSRIMIEWYKGSKVVTNSKITLSNQILIAPHLYKRNATLTLQNVRYEDGGRYWCHASNVFGSDWSETANFTIVVAPRLSPDLKKEITARSGETVYIPCSATGMPTPNIQFNKEKGGLTFPAVAEKRITYTNHMFGIQHVKIKDSGVYLCTAISPVGTAYASITLTVIEEPKFIRQMRSKTIMSGATAVVDCIVSGNPIPTIVWYKNDMILKSSKRIKVSNQLVVISSFDYGDEGTYVCQASNRLGTSRQSARLRVGEEKKTGSSKLHSDIFITVIVITVVAVTVLTSLVWVSLICICRKRRREKERKEKLNLVSLYTEESLLPDMPKDYVLRCNGKLVHAPTQADLLIDPLIKEARDYLRQQQQPDDTFVVPELVSENMEDDSGIGVIYPPTRHDRPTRSSSSIARIYTQRFNDEKISTGARENIEQRKTPELKTAADSSDAVESKDRLLPFQRYPEQLKLRTLDYPRFKLSSSERVRFDELSSANNPHDEFYHSSSGVESGGSLSSSENVSLMNDKAGDMLVV